MPRLAKFQKNKLKMDDDLILIVDFENICRLCLHSTEAMSDIFDTYGEKSLRQLILLITGLATQEGDGLPSKICHRCRHVVEQASDLRDVVDKSREILARTALGNREKCINNDFDNDTFLENISNEKHQDLNADTIIIENYVYDSPVSSIDKETPVEEYDACQESVDMTQDTELVKEENVMTEIPAQVHRRKNYGRRPPADLSCQLCLCQFATKEEVRTHVEAHYAGSDLEIYLDYNSRLCTFCDEMQLNKPQLVKHHRRHLGINPYVCKFLGCTYEGKDRDGLRHHRAVHEARSRVCEECGAAFRRRSDLVSHMSRLHPRAAQARLTSRVCASCGLRSRNEPALRRHMQAHHFVPRFPCPYGSCERAYRSRRALADHERAHRGERRYRCPLCNVADFTSAISVKRHMKMHDRSRMTKCDKCPATFEEFAAFYRHRTAHHGPWPPHHCRECYQGYENESELEKHEQACERLLAYKQEHKNGQTDTHHTDTESMQVSQEEVLYLEMEDKEGTDEAEYTWANP